MKGTVAKVAAVGAIAAGALVAGSTVVDVTPSKEVVVVGPGTTELQEGQYAGPCSIVTPPQPDPCEAAQGVIRASVLGHLVNAKPYQNWRKGAPLDAARLDAVLVNPQCPTPVNPQPQTLTTFMGAAIGAAVQAYACALGTGPLTWPAPNPPPVTGATDTKPPTPPGPVTVTP